jgi:hypothetical protein
VVRAVTSLVALLLAPFLSNVLLGMVCQFDKA